jgi:hypothetical protein
VLPLDELPGVLLPLPAPAAPLVLVELVEFVLVGLPCAEVCCIKLTAKKDAMSMVEITIVDKMIL